MRDRESTHPFVFFFFVLTRLGFSVALAASIVAIGVSANLWRFLWGPVADLTLTARRWYLLGLGTSAATLLLLAFLPLNQNAFAILMAVVFVSQVAATLIVLPVGGLMAHTVAAIVLLAIGAAPLPQNTRRSLPSGTSPLYI